MKLLVRRKYPKDYATTKRTDLERRVYFHSIVITYLSRYKRETRKATNKRLYLLLRTSLVEKFLIKEPVKTNFIERCKEKHKKKQNATTSQ